MAQSASRLAPPQRRPPKKRPARAIKITRVFIRFCIGSVAGVIDAVRPCILGTFFPHPDAAARPRRTWLRSVEGRHLPARLLRVWSGYVACPPERLASTRAPEAARRAPRCVALGQWSLERSVSSSHPPIPFSSCARQLPSSDESDIRCRSDPGGGSACGQLQGTIPTQREKNRGAI